MAPDDLEVIVADAEGNELASYPIRFSAPLRVGQEIWLTLGGAARLCRVLREPAGEGTKVVHVIEVPLRCPFCRGQLLAPRGMTGVDHDLDGEFIVCNHCERRVAMERIPTTPPGGPGRLRVAAHQ